MSESKIRNPKRMRQLIDFKGLKLNSDDGDVYPTDIDGIIEYKNSEYIILEVKHDNARTPYGQKLAFERMVDDFTRANKKAIAIISEHRVDDVNTPVIAAKCHVREFYISGGNSWEEPDERLTVKELIDRFCANTASRDPQRDT